MGDDGDFSSYVVARWPCLIRSLVLLGSTYAEADAVARDALARCRATWEHDRDTDDMDAQVFRILLEQRERLERQRRKGPPDGVPDLPEPPLLVDPTYADPERRLAQRRALADALARLPVEERTVLVLRFVAELARTRSPTSSTPVPTRCAAARPTGWRVWTWRRCGGSGERAGRCPGVPRGRGGGPRRSAAGRGGRVARRGASRAGVRNGPWWASPSRSASSGSAPGWRPGRPTTTCPT